MLVGHVPVRVRTLDASNAGQRSIEHQIGLAGMSTAEREVMEEDEKSNVFAEAMRTQNFPLIPESIARKSNQLLDNFSQPLAGNLYRAYVRNKTALTPTLVTMRALTFIDDIVKQDDPRSQYIPPAMRERWKPENGMLTRYRTPAYIKWRKREFAKTMEQIPIAHRAGVTFLAGTDMNIPFVHPGFSVHDELALLVQAGLSPLDALRTATINPARHLGIEQSAGSITQGKTADLVILDADPTRDIAATTRIFAVIRRGQLLQRPQLDALLAAAAAAARQ